MESRTRSKDVLKKLYEGVNNVLEKVSFRYEVINFPVKYRERSIDIVANSKEHGALIIRIKDLMHVNKNEAQDLIKSSLALNAIPFVVSEAPEVYENIVIEKEGVYLVNLKTFQNMYSREEDLIALYKRGELFVKVDSEIFSRKRTELKHTLTSLSSLLNISRKTLETYEKRGGNITIETAEKLASVLGDEVIRSISVKDLREEFVSKSVKEQQEFVSSDSIHVRTNLKKLFNVDESKIYEIKRSAPDYIIKNKETLITVDVTRSRSYNMREILIKTSECLKFSRITEAGVRVVTDDAEKAKVIKDSLSAFANKKNLEVIKV
ncbi:MAG: helix-turn-helix domain-containing protein [Desulfurococcaceae archaeon TW002]